MEGTAGDRLAADQPRCRCESQAFQAGHAGSIPVTRSAASSREPVHGCSATSPQLSATAHDSHCFRRTGSSIRPGAGDSPAWPLPIAGDVASGQCCAGIVSVRVGLATLDDAAVDVVADRSATPGSPCGGPRPRRKAAPGVPRAVPHSRISCHRLGAGQ